MRKLLFLIFVLKTLTSFSQIQVPNLVWAKNMGGPRNDYGTAITTDVLGNVYTTGVFSGIADFDPSSGTFNLTTLNGAGSNVSDIFISKLDASGQFIWAANIGGLDEDYSRSIITDFSGNVYTTGFFKGTADFDPGPGIFNMTSNGLRDIYILKLNSNGNFIWAKQIGGTSNDEGFSIKIDNSGNIITTGVFNGTVDFDPGIGTFFLSPVAANAFIQKLDSNGNFIWAKRLGPATGLIGTLGTSIDIDATGNIYTTGHFSQTADFDPGPGIFNLNSSGLSDVYVSKLDSNGNFIWAKNMGGTQHDNAHGIVVDALGNIYTTGVFYGTSDFDPGPGTYNLTTIQEDAFISKLDANGNFIWAKSIQATNPGSYGMAKSIALDNFGDVYITGYYYGTADYDPGPGVFISTCIGPYSDAFTLHLDMNGNFVWVAMAKHINVNDGLYGEGVAIDLTGYIYTTGTFYRTADFDPGPNIFTLNTPSLNPGGGSQDAFITKLTTTDSCASYVNYQTSICKGDSIFVAGAFQSISGTYTDSLLNSINCDSLINTNLTVINPVVTIITDSICYGDSIFLGGTYQSNSGVYSDTLIGYNSCDSIFSTLLSVIQPITHSDTITICQGDSIFIGGEYQLTSGLYTDTLVGSNNCDSIIFTNLNITQYIEGKDSISICEGDSVFIGGVYQTVSGIYNDTLQLPFSSCDSIVYKTLTILPSPIVHASYDTSVFSCNPIQLNASGADSYSWTPSEVLNCSNCANPILITPNSSTFVVAGQINGCFGYDTVKVSAFEASPIVIPNVFSPNGDGINDYFTISGDCIKSVEKKIFNRWGMLIFSSNLINEVWDGRTTSGVQATSGTYFYIINVEIIIAGETIIKSYKGTISLLKD